MPISKNITNGMISAGRLLTAVKNSPEQYENRQTQYMGDPSTEFVHRYAKYATNFFEARVQGLDPRDPMSWETAYIRMADIAPDTASTLRKQDDYKIIMFADESIDYVPEGAKIECMGSTWLVVNPANISSAIGGGVIQRCRAVWNHLDWYGNLLSEPLCAEKAILTANESDMQEYTLITKGYVNLTCQRNFFTRQLNTNSRIILGSGAYRITGFGDWSQEFTGNYDSVRLLEFTARYEPANPEIDDMERHVAGGKTFSWQISISGQPRLRAGQKVKMTATSMRCGEYASGTREHPVDYIWSSSNEEIAQIRPDGVVTAISGGECTIRCTLAQNQDIFEEYALLVEPVTMTPETVFLGSIPKSLCGYESFTIEAAYFSGGIQTDETVTFSFEGPDDRAYSTEVNGNRATITCWQGDDTPLRVRAICNGSEAEAEIILKGI